MDTTDTKRGTLNQQETVLYSFDKSAKEQIRLSETVFQGRPYIDFRIFTRLSTGEFVPTKKGLTVSKDLAKALKEGFNKIA